MSRKRGPMATLTTLQAGRQATMLGARIGAYLASIDRPESRGAHRQYSATLPRFPPGAELDAGLASLDGAAARRPRRAPGSSKPQDRAAVVGEGSDQELLNPPAFQPFSTGTPPVSSPFRCVADHVANRSIHNMIGGLAQRRHDLLADCRETCRKASVTSNFAGTVSLTHFPGAAVTCTSEPLDNLLTPESVDLTGARPPAARPGTPSPPWHPSQ